MPRPLFLIVLVSIATFSASDAIPANLDSLLNAPFTLECSQRYCVESDEYGSCTGYEASDDVAVTIDPASETYWFWHWELEPGAAIVPRSLVSIDEEYINIELRSNSWFPDEGAPETYYDNLVHHISIATGEYYFWQYHGYVSQLFVQTVIGLCTPVQLRAIE